MSGTGFARKVVTLVGLFVSLFALALSASNAQADTLEECQQKLMSGQLDLQGYLACISPTTTVAPGPNPTSSNNSGNNNAGSGNAGRVYPVSSTSTSGALPTTGSSSGRFVAVGAALIVLGGAAIYGAAQSRRRSAVSEAGPTTTEE